MIWCSTAAQRMHFLVIIHTLLTKFIFQITQKGQLNSIISYMVEESVSKKGIIPKKGKVEFVTQIQAQS